MMRVSELAPARNHPLVQSFLEQVLDGQFIDVRAMLQLPRPDVGIVASCNFAAVATLCNLISGVSTTLFKPVDLLHEIGSSSCGSGKAFRELVRTFFPEQPGVADCAKRLYEVCRNPLAHSAAIGDLSQLQVEYRRVLKRMDPNEGWSDEELENLEREDRHHNISYPSIAQQDGLWRIHVDKMYLDTIEMLRRLNRDEAQMQAAEKRFSAGIFNWRRQ